MAESRVVCRASYLDLRRQASAEKKRFAMIGGKNGQKDGIVVLAIFFGVRNCRIHGMVGACSDVLGVTDFSEAR